MMQAPQTKQQRECIMKTSLRGLVVAMGVVLSTSAMAADISFSVENLSHGNHFTPLLISAHPAGTHLFQTGTAASANLQAMAEGGDIAGLVTDTAAISADVIENPAMGLLAPGASASGMMMTAAANTHLSVVSMIFAHQRRFYRSEQHHDTHHARHLRLSHQWLRCWNRGQR